MRVWRPGYCRSGVAVIVAVEFLGQRRPHKVKEIADALLEFLRFGDERVVEFQ
jgi:hypothetical protein